MRSSSYLTLFAAVVALAVFTTPAGAEPVAGGKGSIKGKVVSADGKPAAGLPVRLLHAAGRKAAADRGAAPADSPRRRRAKGAGGAANKAEAAGETTADAAGEFAFADVAPGRYVVVARMKGVGAARERVTVAADNAASVTITLKAASEARPKGKRKAKAS